LSNVTRNRESGSTSLTMPFISRCSSFAIARPPKQAGAGERAEAGSPEVKCRVRSRARLGYRLKPACRAGAPQVEASDVA
jgi:hypothetical protein